MISLRELAQVERLAGFAGAAREHALQALALADGGSQSDQAAACLLLLGKISLSQDEVNRAHAEFSRGLAAAIDSRSFLTAAFCCEELGAIAAGRGDAATAETFFAGAEDAFWRTPGIIEMSRSNAARVAEEIADLRQAS